MRIMYALTKVRLLCCGQCDANGPETSDVKLMNISIVPIDVKINNAKNPRYNCSYNVRGKPVLVSFALCWVEIPICAQN